MSLEESLKGITYLATDWAPKEQGQSDFIAWVTSREALDRLRRTPEEARKVKKRPYLWLFLDGKPMWVVEGPEE